MQGFCFRSALSALALSSLLSATTLAAQTPQTPPSTPQTPPVSPAQRDATRPPGTEQRQAAPPDARPTTSDPTAPPGTNRAPAQAPPGTDIAPTTPPHRVAPETPAAPGVTNSPANPSSGATPSGTALPDTTNPNAPVREPNMPQAQSRPVPPVPTQTRLGIQSGNVLPLSLNEAIRRALENNNDIQVARDDVRYAESRLRSLEGFYDPIFTFNPQVQNSVTPQASSLGGGSTVTQTDYIPNANITKPFSVGGGNYTLFFNNDRRTTSSLFSTLSPFYSSSFGVQFTQPLLRDRSIDINRRNIRVQRKLVAQSDADFRRRTIDIINQVQRAYWDLVFALRDQENRLNSVNLARENFRRTEAGVVAGATAPLQRAEVDTELAQRETDLFTATQQVSIAENALKQLILKDPLKPEWSAAIMPTDQPKVDDTPVNLASAIDEARANRPELARQRLQQEINDIDVQYFKNQTKPRIDVQATLSTTGLAGTPVPITQATTIDPTTGQPLPAGQTFLIPTGPPYDTTNATSYLFNQLNALRVQQGLPPLTSPIVTTRTNSVAPSLIGGYGQTLSNLFSFNTRNIVVGVNIQIPLRNRTAQANLAGALIQRDQNGAAMRSQELVVETDVRNAAQNVETARQRVVYARQTRQSAEQQLLGEQKLYAVGRSTTYLLFQREDALVAARSQELRAETDYNKALADLQRATSTTLHANNVVVESPAAP